MKFNFLYAIVYKKYKGFKRFFYLHWNKIKFSQQGADFKSGFKVYNGIYLSIEPGALLKIGENVTITSGDCINPLCRNIKACIHLERRNSIVTIGNDTGLSSPCIWAKEKITIGNRVKIGGDCILIDSDAHNLDYRVRASRERVGKVSKDVFTAKTAPIVIHDDVFIGTRCIILKGVEIGARSIIAAGSIVTNSIPEDCVAAGNPCRVIKNLSLCDT